MYRNPCEFNCKGHGEMRYSDFHRYVGQWLDNKKHGVGSFSYREGHVYVGAWVQDERHGQGMMTFSPGTVSEEVGLDSHCSHPHHSTVPYRTVCACCCQSLLYLPLHASLTWSRLVNMTHNERTIHKRICE